MFIVALLIIVEHWKQPKCLFTGEWINKVKYIHKVKYYPAIKRKGLLITYNDMNEFQKDAEPKRQTQVYLLNDCIFVKFYNIVNP